MTNSKLLLLVGRLAAPALFLAITLSGCSGSPLSARESGALGGGALGAGLGAIVGHATGSTGAGIAIGGAVGALSGALIGNELDNQNEALAEREGKLREQDLQIARNKKLLEELRGQGVDARETRRGVVANIPDVFFEFDSARLTSDAYRVAGHVAEVVKRQPERHISVEGHTDSVGTVAYNQRLSVDRARSVADELARDGVPRRRLSVVGHGESTPIATNNTASGRQKNRRVEVVIEN